jgi:deoxyribonuclease-4
MARELGAVARLWEAVGDFGAGFVLDTCHAWAAGWDLARVVDDVRAVTGRIDLVHLNNSRDPAGSGRDRHAPLTAGEIPLELLVGVARAAGCPVVLETPGDAAGHAEEITLLRGALGGPR